MKKSKWKTCFMFMWKTCSIFHIFKLKESIVYFCHIGNYLNFLKFNLCLNYVYFTNYNNYISSLSEHQLIIFLIHNNDFLGNFIQDLILR